MFISSDVFVAVGVVTASAPCYPSNISDGSAFLHKGVTSCGFRRLVCYNLTEKSLQYGTVQYRFGVQLSG